MKRRGMLRIVGGLGIIIVATAVAPQNPSWNGGQRAVALALEQKGQVAEAEAAWQAIAKRHPDDAEAYAHIGLLFAREERYQDAVSNYRKALALNRSMPDVRLNLGLAYFKSGDMRSAVTTFEPLLRADVKGSPQAIRLSTLIGLADYGLGAYASAVPHLKEAIAADPQNLPFRMFLAQSCLWSKQYQCVLEAYREILSLNAESAEADMLAGEAYDEMKNETAAMEQFRAAVKADPRAPEVHFGYGYLLWRELKFAEAAEEFKAELANNPDHPFALTYLADTEIRFSHSDDAVPQLEHAIRIQPSIALAHLDLGVAYENLQRNRDALRELKAAEKLSPDDQKVHWQLGRLYRSLGRKAEAKVEFDKTKNLQEAADQPLVEKLQQAQRKPAGQSVGKEVR